MSTSFLWPLRLSAVLMSLPNFELIFYMRVPKLSEDVVVKTEICFIFSFCHNKKAC